MSVTICKIGDFCIPGTGSDSTSFENIQVGSNWSIGIYTPLELSGTAYLQSSQNGVDFFNVQVAGADVTLAPNRFVVVPQIPAKTFRVESSTPELDDRVFSFWCILGGE